MYTPGYIPAIDGQWDNVYSALAQFRKLESLYEEESAAEQAQDEAFYLAAKVQLYDFFAATVDVFGDMPFSEACTLPLTNDVGKSYAHYDKAEDIYKPFLMSSKKLLHGSVPSPHRGTSIHKTLSTTGTWTNGNAMQTPCDCALPCA